MLPFLLAFLAATPDSAAGDVIRFKGNQALVSDTMGVPLFIGTRDFVLKKARNEAGTVVRYDAMLRRVKVSTVGTDLWLSCADLEPMASACPRAPVARRLRGAAQDEGADPGLLARVPACPGDPRCPKAE